MTAQLTKADVSRLLANPSGAARAEAAAKIARQFEQQVYSPRERKLAEEIIRLMAKDAEQRVREALANHLKECDELPRDIALALAKDVSAVALPLLQFSSVLTDPDLIEIVRSQDADKQVAIAGRKSVSASLSHTLVQHGGEAAVARLVTNTGAEIEEGTLQTVLDRFPGSDTIAEGIVRRPALPATVAERLVSLVSDAMQDYLVTHHELSPTVATDIVLQGRERATVGLLAPDADDTEAERLVRRLQVNGRLTPSLVLRALCMGDVTFFEAAIAVLANVPITNARILIHDKGALGFKALYEKANLSEALFDAFRCAVEVIHETEFDGGPADRDRYRRRVMERILTQFEHLGSIGRDNLDYLVDKLARLEEVA
jgi:uncharacterized protein (DUF2336 family)